MNNKTALKIFFLILLMSLDLGFIPRFAEYDLKNKIFVVICFCITILLMRSLVKSRKQNNLDSIK